MNAKVKPVQETEDVKIVSTGSFVNAMLDSKENDAKPVSKNLNVERI